ncbi:TatD family hydrolase [Spongisporangium articulatum]|uniref:TatD family hydrolase n=1 Tax=Spongisporangium articulatum TaxID=3362603 RepID=A0ABW8AT23_9ACTN
MNELLSAYPPAPERLPSPVTDNHTHLDHVRGEGEGVFPDESTVAELIERAKSVNVHRMVQIGCDLAAARWTVQAVDRHEELLGGVALHPTEATKHHEAGTFESAWQEIEELAGHERVRVVGETGLDHYWVDDAKGRLAQEESFRRHIDLAKRTGKVLQIHDRDAHDDVIRILNDEKAPEKTVFHCFSGDEPMARYCVEQGWYLSFAGTVTFKNAHASRAALAAVPPEFVLIETDAPYLTPVPFRGKPNASYLIPHSLRVVADVTQRDVAQVCAQLEATTQAVYGAW